MISIPLLSVDNSWFQHAACRGMDPELFFPTRGDSYSLKQARQVCADCPVSPQCLDYALSQPFILQGVWAGRSERERRRMRLSNSAALRTPIAPAREQEPLLP